MRVSGRFIAIMAAFFFIVLGPVAPKVRGENNTVELLGEGASVAVIDDQVGTRFAETLKGTFERIRSFFVYKKKSEDMPVKTKPKLEPERFNFDGWHWEKISSGKTQWETDKFDMALDVVPWSNKYNEMKKEEFAFLTKIYFEKVLGRHRSALKPEFAAEFIYILTSGGRVRLATALELRTTEPVRFAQLLSSVKPMEYLRRFKAAVSSKYDKKTPVISSENPIIDYMEGNGNEDSTKTVPKSGCNNLAAMFLPTGCGKEESVIAYREESAEYRLVNAKGQEFDVSKLSEAQKADEGNINYRSRSGSAVSFVNIDSNFGRHTSSDYELFRFGGGNGNCSFNSQFQADFKTSYGKEFHKGKHQHKLALSIQVAEKKK